MEPLVKRKLTYMYHQKKGESTLFKDMIDTMDFLRKNMNKDGTIIMNPTGSAIVKIIMEVLGETLGAESEKLTAQTSKAARIHPPREELNADVLHPNFIPEHLAYLDSLRARFGSEATMENPSLSIFPVIGSAIPENMLTQPGYEQYETFLQTKRPVSLRITLSVALIPEFMENFKKLLKAKTT